MISGTGNTAPGLTMSTVLFILWAFCSYITRAWTKYRKTDTWGRDDTALTFALLVAILQVAAILYGVHRGYGGAWADLSESDLDAVSKAQFAGQLFFVMSTGATRASAAAFAARVLTMDVRQQRIADGLVGLCILWTIGSTIGIAIRPPLPQPWVTLDGSQTMSTRWLSIETTGVILDICSIALSAFFIWQLQMKVSKRLIVIALLAARLVTLPIIACRLWALSPKPEAVKRPNMTAAILTEAEICFALILASAVCLKPLLQPFHPGWFVAKSAGATGLTGNHSGNNSKRGNTYYELSGLRASSGMSRGPKKQSAITSVTSARERSDMDSDELELVRPEDKSHITRHGLRPDLSESQATAFAAPATPISDVHVSVDQPRWNGGRGGAHHISKAQAWSVTYE